MSRSQRYVRLNPDGTREEGEFSIVYPCDWLAAMQQLCGGYIEAVRVRYDGFWRDAYVDEEALIKKARPPFNLLATKAIGADIYGPMVIIVGVNHGA